MLEHVAQAIHVFVLGWPRVQALGLLGLVGPGLVQSEWLHFSDVPLTLVGLVVLRPGFLRRSTPLAGGHLRQLLAPVRAHAGVGTRPDRDDAMGRCTAHQSGTARRAPPRAPPLL